jgi:PAS domain S-box-containing protein
MLIENFLTITAALPEAFFLVSETGEILGANLAAEQMLGVGRAALQGQRITTFLVDPHDKVLSYIRLCLRNKSLMPGALTWRAVDGSSIASYSKGVMVDPGLTHTPGCIILRCKPKSVAHDQFKALNTSLEQLTASYHKLEVQSVALRHEITEREEAEAEILRLNERLEQEIAQLMETKVELEHAIVRAEGEKAKSEAIIGAIGDGISIHDTDFKVLYQNPVSENLVGKHSGEYCYRGYRGKETVCADCPLVMSFRDGKIHTAASTIYHGAEPVYVEITASPLRDATGRIIAAIEVIRNITERNRAELALRESERKFRALFDQAFQFIGLMTIDGVIIAANQTALQFAGISESDVLNKPFWETHWWKHSKPLQDQLRQAVRKAAQGDLVRFEATHSAADGSLHYVDFSIKPILNDNGDVVLLIPEGRDITERKKAEERLRKEGERGNILLELYETAPLLTDKQLYDYALEQAVSLTDSAIGFFHLVSDDQRNVILTTWNTEALKNCTASYDTHYPIDAAGNWVDCVRLKRPVIYNDFENSPNRKGLPEGHSSIDRFMSIPVMEGDKARIIFGVGNKVEEYDDHDIMHIQLVANELQKIITQRRVEETLKEARQQLIRKEKLSVLGRLAGVVGHEMRNPLGVMNNAVYFLKTVMADADDTAKEYLDIIKHEIDDSQRIIADLLDFSRTRTPQMATIAVRELVDKSLGKCAIPANVMVCVDIPDPLLEVNVDPFQMGQVFENLITNAVQAMAEGGVLTVAARRVQSSEFRVQSGREDNVGLRTLNSVSGRECVEISVTDTGEGITPENMERLFQPLFTTKTKGIGFGLTICRNLTEANGGRIEVESNPGIGTAFVVLLPLKGGKE